MAASDAIYSATYSNVPVFEFNVEGNHVMRRRYDNYINATHILKVADYDKPARTRILEREVQKGTHEKIQGGYGKYQGTWVPLKDGRTLAERNGVLDKLLPIFDYVPGDISPPQAPKHTTNSNRPKVPRAPAVRKAPKPKVNPNYTQLSEDFDNISAHLHDDDSPDNSTIETASFMDGDDGYGHRYPPSSRKRKRGQQDLMDQQHTIFADALLDYFILSSCDPPSPYPPSPPKIPENFENDRPIDNLRHTALHWAAAMGDIDIVRLFLQRGANTAACNERGETPLIRAVVFTNNYEKDTMMTLVQLLSDTIGNMDRYGATVLHHIAMTTSSQAKRKCARYYLDIILTKLFELPNHDIRRILNAQDKNGDTALHIAARHNAKKCVRALQGRGANGDIPNRAGETADQIIQSLRAVRQDYFSSSPAQAGFGLTIGNQIGKCTNGESATHYHTEIARSFSQSFEPIVQEKGLQMSLALESESREKDEILREAQVMLARKESERHSVRKETLQLSAQADASNEEETTQRLQEEYQAAMREGESYSEQLQHKELHNTVRTEEQTLPPEVHNAKKKNMVMGDAELEARWRAGLELAVEQNKRRKLTTAVIEAEGSAGMSQTGEALKRLISETMDVPREDVVHMVPDILEELEQSKMDVRMDVAVEV